MTYNLTSTIAGQSEGLSFNSLEDALAYVRDFATAAFESGCAEDFELQFADAASDES